jgi:heme oxygenase
MNARSGGKLDLGNDICESEEPEFRVLLRAATQAPHERLHHHAGFSAVKDGIITRADYRALLIRLYGFYSPFERAAGLEPLRTEWLARDLAYAGVEDAARRGIRLCPDIPSYNAQERRLGARYVVEGSALGGRMLCRGLDGLFGAGSIEGRCFFNGRGGDTGDSWLGFLAEIAAAGCKPAGRAAIVSAAIETFEIFEAWLRAWDETT